MSFDDFQRAVSGVPPVVTAPTRPDGAAFAALGLAAELASAVGRAGYTAPTEVQAQTIPLVLQGTDLLVSAQTGSGKTAAFVLPALQRVLQARQDPAQRRTKGVACGPRILVLAPTRELALQVTRACSVYGATIAGLRVASVVGGVPYGAQLKALRGPLDVLVATPGRLMDLMRSGSAVLRSVQVLVLDEADRMLDMGFIDDIRFIAQALPATRQTLMFSATFGGEVGDLARSLTREPRRVNVAGHTDRHQDIEQRLYWADSPGHRHALLEHLLVDRDVEQALVFTSTQREADHLADRLADIGHPVASLHGGMPQGRRTRVLTDLRQRRLRVLVATDVASRGIDVPSITHVFNVGLPMKAEDYVHRIGRTGRAGRTGLAITLAERRDTPAVRRVERFTTQRIAEATVPGMEPRPAPKVVHARPAAKPPVARRGGKPARPAAGRSGPRR